MHYVPLMISDIAQAISALCVCAYICVLSVSCLRCGLWVRLGSYWAVSTCKAIVTFWDEDLRVHFQCDFRRAQVEDRAWTCGKEYPFQVVLFGIWLGSVRCAEQPGCWYATCGREGKSPWSGFLSSLRQGVPNFGTAKTPVLLASRLIVAYFACCSSQKHT